jgi:hypothetical protein
MHRDLKYGGWIELSPCGFFGAHPDAVCMRVCLRVSVGLCVCVCVCVCRPENLLCSSYVQGQTAPPLSCYCGVPDPLPLAACTPQEGR